MTTRSIHDKKYKAAWRKKRQAQANELVGDHCCVCGTRKYRLILHRIDGVKHKAFDSMTNEQYETELRSGRYVRVCYLCHKGIHWCMEFMQMDWDEIKRGLRCNGCIPPLHGG